MQAPKSSLFTETHTMLSLGLLGPFQATLGEGAEIKFRTHKEQALLAFLAVEASRPHRREALAELLWPERPEGMARTNLRQALAGLRRAISGRHLLTTRTTVQFNAKAEHWLDLAVYEAHWRAIRRHIHDEEATCPICMGHRQQAVALYRGPFLTGLEADDSRDFQEWATVHRESLFRQQVDALRRLTLYRRGLGDLERARRYARRWAELDSLSEAAHRQRMALLALSGRRHEALAQYEACREILSEELGMAPGPETAELYEQIRSRKTRAPAARSPAAPQHNLLPLLTPTVGRKSELAYLCRRFSQPDCRLLTVVGPGGVGKSRLALRAAEEIYGADLFADGAWFVPLETIPSADLLAVTMAQTLGLELEAKQEPETQLLDYLRPRTMLLVLDNFEHLLGHEGDGACDLVLEILREAPGVKLLITSRERLNCQAEFLLDLEGLPYPQDLSPKFGGQTYPALQLFLERAGRVQAGFAATPETVPLVARICRLVEGLPLGIELAAASLGMRSLEEVARALQESLDALAAPLRDLPRRQRSMRAALEHSWRLLSELEQDTYCRLSVFRGDFDPEAALAVVEAEDVNEELPLQTLADKSLLRRHTTARTEAGLRTASSLRYDLHPLLRQYAAEKLAERPAEEAATRKRHGRFYLALLREREEAIAARHDKAALDQIQGEMGNVRAAWQWAVDDGRVEELGASAITLTRYYDLRGPYAEAVSVFGSAMKRLSDLSRSDVRAAAVLARLQISQAAGLFRRGQFSEMAQVAETAVTVAQRAHDVLVEARARSLWGMALHEFGDLEPARQQLERALALLRTECDAAMRATRAVHDAEMQALNSLAIVCRTQGDWERAQALLEEVLDASIRYGNRRIEAMALNNLAEHASREGRHDDALALYRRSLGMARELGFRTSQGIKHSNLGSTLSKLGEYGRATEHLEQSIAIQRETGARKSEAIALTGLAFVCHHQGKDEAARQHCLQALRLLEECGEHRFKGTAYLNLGCALVGLGRLDEAAEAYRNSMAKQRELGWENETMEPLAGLARVALAREDLVQAQSHIEGILAHLESGATGPAGPGHALDGTMCPTQVYLTCYRVLETVGDPRAGSILAEGYDLLQGRAAKIRDDKLRHSFLENVAAHRELVQAFGRMGDSQ